MIVCFYPYKGRLKPTFPSLSAESGVWERVCVLSCANGRCLMVRLLFSERAEGCLGTDVFVCERRGGFCIGVLRSQKAAFGDGCPFLSARRGYAMGILEARGAAGLEDWRSMSERRERHLGTSAIFFARRESRVWDWSRYLRAQRVSAQDQYQSRA